MSGRKQRPVNVSPRPHLQIQFKERKITVAHKSKHHERNISLRTTVPCQHGKDRCSERHAEGCYAAYNTRIVDGVAQAIRSRGDLGKQMRESAWISVTFIDRDGSEYKVQASVGEDMLSVAHREDIDLEGACEGSLACSTCHVVITDQDYFDRIPEADDDENDMLDLAFGLTQTSRLGCQVKAQPELDGMVMRIPDATRNFAVDGHRPKPH